jgi:hypothetical protein
LFAPVQAVRGTVKPLLKWVESRPADEAICINIAEQPARLQLDDRSLLAQWQPAYKRGYVMQASLAIVCGFFGLAAYLSAFD